ncbi:MAG: thioredoxin family protein [Bacteroidia bacterium]
MKMIKHSSLLIVLALFIFAFAPTISSELGIGKKAPKTDYKMKDVTGKELSLNQIKGENGLLVIFSCNTCPWVINWQDRYNELHDVARKHKVGMVAVNSNEGQRSEEDSFDAMANHAKANGYTFSYVQDTNSELADAFGATRTPHVFLFDKNMNLVYRGAIDDNAKDRSAVEKPYLKNAIESMVKGEEIYPSTTKSLGCTIKRKAS